MSRSKVNGNYVNSIVALNEALEAGFDEALMLDTEGNVAEGSGENFFMVKDGKIFTPDVEASLNGITRKSIIDIKICKASQMFCKRSIIFFFFFIEPDIF